MLQDNLSAYEASLTVQDKSSYVKAARMCAEYFDGQGIASPSDEDFAGFTAYAREEYFKAQGRMPSERTLRQNYEGRARLFMKWIAAQASPANLSSRPQAATGTRPQSVRIVLDCEAYDALSVLAIIEGKSLAAVVLDAVRGYVEAHAEQAAIVAAIVSAREGRQGKEE